MPSIYDCPECNGQGSRSYERLCHEPYRRERTPVHDRQRKKVSVHDRLVGRIMLHDPARRRVPAHDRLEQMADDRVQDDQPMTEWNMISRCEEIQNVSLFARINLNGVQEV